MALRKFTYIETTEGVVSPQDSTDELNLGKVTFSGVGGIAVDAGSQRITAVANPTAGTDAANKQYVDGYINGLTYKAPVRAATTANLAWTAAGSGVGATLTSTTNALANNDLDGVTLVVTNRVLIKNQSTGADNGIYTLTQAADGSSVPAVFTRATDFDEDSNAGGADEVKAGAYVIVNEGTTQADTAWVLTTNDPITIDSTAQVWTLFPSAITGGAGILYSSNTVSVELDTDADAQGTGADGGSSGLEFDVTGAAGQLRAKVDPAGGIQRGASGLLLEIDNTPDTLDVDADGLKVVGLPSLFKINDVAVSANVTAANLGTLTAGSSSDASALHTHSWVEDAERTRYNFTASGAVAATEVVRINGNNSVSTVDISALGTSHAIGISIAGAADTATCQVIMQGYVPGVLTGATAGTAYYAGSAGLPVVYSSVPSSSRIVFLGYAANATDLVLNIQERLTKP